MCVCVFNKGSVHVTLCSWTAVWVSSYPGTVFPSIVSCVLQSRGRPATDWRTLHLNLSRCLQLWTGGDGGVRGGSVMFGYTSHDDIQRSTCNVFERFYTHSVPHTSPYVTPACQSFRQRPLEGLYSWPFTLVRHLSSAHTDEQQHGGSSPLQHCHSWPTVPKSRGKNKPSLTSTFTLDICDPFMTAWPWKVWHSHICQIFNVFLRFNDGKSIIYIYLNISKISNS